VLDRPRSDPAVQDVINRRRRLAADALRMYREAR
jgi:hypothetical protein